MDCRYILEPKPGRLAADELRTVAVHFHRPDAPYAPGTEFKSNRAGSAKEVKHFQVLELPVIVNHIEQGLLGIVGSGPCRISVWRVDSLALKGSSYYPHIARNCSTALK